MRASAFAVLGLSAACQAQIGIIPATAQTPSLVLANALVGQIGAASFAFRTGADSQFGQFTVGQVRNAYNLFNGGILLSTGDVTNYGTGPNTTVQPGFTLDYLRPSPPRDVALLQPITGTTNMFDSALLNITFSANLSQRVVFAFVFGSEEWPRFVRSQFVDGFGIYLNGVNIAHTGDLQLINVNNPNFPAAPIAETELNNVIAWGGTARLMVTCRMPSTLNTLEIVIGDASDGWYDSTVYLEPLRYVACNSDFNGDGVVNANDLTAFNRAYINQDFTADYDGDGVVTPNDQTLFMQDYQHGC